MPWEDETNDIFVIPTGATSGARIVLDGTTGKISVYDAGGNLVATIDSSGLTALGGAANAGAAINIGVTGAGVEQLQFTPPPIVGHTYTPGTIQVASDAVLGPSIALTTPQDAGNFASIVKIFGGGDAGHPSRTEWTTEFLRLFGNELPEPDFQIANVSQGRGFRNGGFKTSDSGAIGGTETVVNFTVGGMTFRAARVYRVTVCGVVNGTPSGAVMRLRKTQLVSGALVCDFGVVGGYSNFTPPPAPMFFGNGTGSDIVGLDMCMSLQATGANTNVWSGTGNRPSGFEIEDVGDLNGWNLKAPVVLL